MRARLIPSRPMSKGPLTKRLERVTTSRRRRARRRVAQLVALGATVALRRAVRSAREAARAD